MNLLTIAYKSIRQRMLASSLTGLSVALGIMLMVGVLVIHGILDRMFSQQSVGYDLIVGPKGSSLQLVLNTVYRVSQPIENLPYRFYEQLKGDSRIAEAVPMALGDVTREGGFPIVGTESGYFEIAPPPGRPIRIKGDKFKTPFDAIIGARVARKNGWDVGTRFSLVHGGADSDHVHDEQFTVVGVLAPTGTPNDKTVFLPLEGFYRIEGHKKPADEARKREREFFGEPMAEAASPGPAPGSDGASDRHAKDRSDGSERSDGGPAGENEEEDGEHHEDEHHEGEHGHHELEPVPDEQKEVTAILVRMRRPSGASPSTQSMLTPMFQAELNEGFEAQAVHPIMVMKSLMDDIIGNVQKVLLFLTALIVVVSGIGIFVSIYNSMSDRRREIAVMRALGASRTTVFSIILAESVLLCFGGGVLGILLGHGLIFAAAPFVEAETGILIDPLAFEPIELVLLPALIGLASLVGFLPGLTAYRTDVAKALAE